MLDGNVKISVQQDQARACTAGIPAPSGVSCQFYAWSSTTARTQPTFSRTQQRSTTSITSTSGRQQRSSWSIYLDDRRHWTRQNSAEHIDYVTIGATWQRSSTWKRSSTHGRTHPLNTWMTYWNRDVRPRKSPTTTSTHGSKSTSSVSDAERYPPSCHTPAVIPTETTATWANSLAQD